MKVLCSVVLAFCLCLPTVTFAGGVFFKDGKCPEEFVLPTNLVTYIQIELKREGLYRGPVNGQYSDAIVNAIRMFRMQHNLTTLEDGYVDLAFLKALLRTEFENIANREMRIKDCERSAVR